jgi:hypothetical protein
MSEHGDERQIVERKLREALERAQADYLSASRENQASAKERYLEAVYAFAMHVLQDPEEAKLAVSLLTDQVKQKPQPAPPESEPGGSEPDN